MVALTTRTASLSPVLDPSPSHAPSAADSLPSTVGNGQSVPSASIGGRWQNRKQLQVLNKHRKDGGNETPENGSDTKGKAQYTPSSLPLPNIFEVRKKNWDKRRFENYSALDIVSSGEGGYNFFVNMDNINLLTELKYIKSSPELLNTRFKYGMVLIGMAILKELELYHRYYYRWFHPLVIWKWTRREWTQFYSYLLARDTW